MGSDVQQQPPPMTRANNVDDSMKVAIAMTLIRSKLFRKVRPNPSSDSIPVSDAQRWKRKAKERKQEILRLKEELKELQEALNCDVSSATAACKCYFFSDLGKLSHTRLIDDSDCHLNDLRRRRFLRQVRLKKISRNRAIDSRLSFPDFNNEEATEPLRISVDFLVDICNRSQVVKGPNFASLAHQAVEYVLGFLNHFLSSGKSIELIEGIISSLIMNLIKSMCLPSGEELHDSETDTEICVQHLLRKLGSVSCAGQLIILSVSQKIAELAESLLFSDPFDDLFPHLHNSVFLMIQLIEFLVSDHLLNWSKDEAFDKSIFQEWLTSIAHARKALELLESRTGIYVVYMDRISGELARQFGQISSLQTLSPQIVDNLFH